MHASLLMENGKFSSFATHTHTHNMCTAYYIPVMYAVISDKFASKMKICPNSPWLVVAVAVDNAAWMWTKCLRGMDTYLNEIFFLSF